MAKSLVARLASFSDTFGLLVELKASSLTDFCVVQVRYPKVQETWYLTPSFRPFLHTISPYTHAYDRPNTVRLLLP